MRVRRSSVVLAAGLLLACGGPAADDTTDPPSTDVASTSAGDDATTGPSTPTDGDPPTDSPTDRPTDRPTDGSSGTATDGEGDDPDPDDDPDDADETGPTAPDEVPEPDAATLAFLQGGLWNVPELETRCGWEGAFGQAAGTVFTRYQDPSDRGDFWVACRTDAGPPDWPLELAISPPSGAATRATVAPSDVDQVVSGFATTVLVVTSAGRARYDGLVVADGDTHVTQVHWWLPHDRPTGTWTVQLGDATGTVDVAAPCGSDTGAPDPLTWPLDIGFARNGFADSGLGDHCRAWPDVLGLDEATAVQAFTDVLGRRDVADDLSVAVDLTCGGGTDEVVEQSPPPGSIEPDEFVGDIRPLVLTVSSGACPTDDPDDTTGGMDTTDDTSDDTDATDDSAEARDDATAVEPSPADAGVAGSDEVSDHVAADDLADGVADDQPTTAPTDLPDTTSDGDAP